ncbi:MAG TPA: lysophospholipid acyltransferase family protein [Sphingomonas sp.]|jgi:1-acyl-sn-glycerol-3-phosphate acyltransferase
MILLRNIAYAIIFYGGSVFIVGTTPITAWFGQRALIRHGYIWTGFHRWCARVLLGIRIRVEGTRPEGAAFYACKHQAMFETLVLQWMLDGPAMAIKQELAEVPFWGKAAQGYGALVVDRGASSSALRKMLREAEAAKSKGRSILIFPEGTRVAVGEQPELKSGFAGLYRLLAMPTVPIACDSGRIWPKRGLKRPGVITFRFGETIPPGLPRGGVEERVHAAINALEELPILPR